MTSFSKLSLMELLICRRTERRVHIRLKLSHHSKNTWHSSLQVCWTWMETHVQLNNPQKGDEEQIERHKEEEGAPHVGDGSALRGWHQQVRGREWQRRRVGSIQGGDGREATPELPVLSTWHSCGETGNSPWNKETKLVQTHDWESDTAGNPD